MSGRSRSLAVALTDALLADDWTYPAMVRQGAEVLGGRTRWLSGLVRQLLAAYRVAPADRPRELADVILASRPFRDHGSRHASQHPVRNRPVRPSRTVQTRWRGPIIHDLADLARWLAVDEDLLDWYADRKGINRRANAGRLHHYRYVWLPGRLIEAPKPRLKFLQRRILDELIGPIPIHDRVHGFVPGRGPHTYAAAHCGQRTVIRVDLTAFFASIAAARVYGLFRTAGYPEPVAHTLTGLCTTRTPPAVLRTAPSTLVDQAYRLALLRGAHLPQGAPTSPALANLCAFRLDRRLAGLADSFGVAYGRYADDLAFSGDLGAVRGRSFVQLVEAIVAEEGFRMHPAKTRMRGRGDRQSLAGLVVNERPAAPREEYDRLRAILHDAARNGLDAANRERRPDFASYLTGRVAWVGHGHPNRAAKLDVLLRAALATRSRATPTSDG